MASGHTEPTEPRIIKKKKSHNAGHGGAWKVAYGDFVTAMMALFIVLWIMGQSQSVRQSVAQYFKNPGILPGATGVMESSDIGGDMPTPGHSQDLQTPSPLTPDIAKEKVALEEVKKRINEVIAQLPELGRLKDQVLMEITDEGLRIELLDKENSHFFDIGSHDLKLETQEILKNIAQELGKLPNHITIEGHTDSRPYGGQNYTNWELSADRANSARRLMEAAGVKPGQVTSVKGCADQQLRNQQDPMDFQNRRVSIVVDARGQSKGKTLKLPFWEDLKNNSQKNGKPGPASTSASSPPAASQTGTPPPAAPKPTKAIPPGTTGPASPKASSPSATAGQEAKPKPTQELRTPARPSESSAAPPSVQRLDDQVREELQQLMQPQGSPRPAAPGVTSRGPAEPRYRLGW